MRLPAALTLLAHRLRRGRRRVSRQDGRWYVEVRPLAEPERPGFADAVEALTCVPGVAWARYNAALERVVVQGEGVDEEALLDAVEALEANLGRRPLSADPIALPRDAEPLRRLTVEIGADVAALAAGTVLRILGRRPGPGGVDVAALLRVIEEVPWLRSRMDTWLGAPTADLTLALADALDAVALQGATGPLVDIAWRLIRARSHTEVAQAWDRWEAEVAGTAEAHPSAPHDLPPRVGDLPRGPAERYNEGATLAALGGFSIGVATTRRFESASAAVLGGVPKAARTARKVFAARAAERLAHLGWMVRDPGALRCLDRLDTVLVHEALVAPTRGELVQVRAVVPGLSHAAAHARVLRMFRPDDPFAVHVEGTWVLGPLSALSITLADPLATSLRAAGNPGGRLLGLVSSGALHAVAAVRPELDTHTEAMLAAVRREHLRLVVATDSPGRVAWLPPDHVVPLGEGLIPALRGLQKEGAGVLVLWPGEHAVLAAADLGVALRTARADAAWSASLVAPDRPDAAGTLLATLAGARLAAVHGVRLSALDAIASLALTLGKPGEATTRGVLRLSNLANAAAMADAWWIGGRVGPLVHRRTPDRTPWHALDNDVVLDRLSTSTRGLAAEEARRRQRPPPVPPTDTARMAALIAEELDNPLSAVLATGAALSALTGSGVDALMVGSVIAMNGAVGATQRMQAERVLAELDRAETRRVRVRRGADVERLPPDEIVPGDVIELESGESVPADARVLVATALEVDESSLTGESVPVPKTHEPSFASAVADRSSMLFAGTTIASGVALAVVVAAGEDTEARAMPASAVSRTVSRGVEARLEALTQFTAPLAAAAGLALLTSGLLRRRPPAEIIGASVALSVAAVPEGLPPLAMLAQLAAARRLAARGALARNPRAIEALGRVDVLCADKTGTLTVGRLALHAVSDGGEPERASALGATTRQVLAVALDATPTAVSGEVLPHPTDQALVVAGAAAGVTSTWVREGEVPFEPSRGWHAVLGSQEGQRRIAVKGAPELVLARCTRRRVGGRSVPMDAAARAACTDRLHALAEAGLRVLAVATRAAPRGALDADVVRGLTFEGFVALADPVRDTARDAVRRLQAAGVAVLMITGDHPATAAAIGRELGLRPGLLTGPELHDLDDDALVGAVQQVGVFARTTPQDKTRLVLALQRAGRVVAMTGDGANDAPAIRAADVGIALGERATAAARQAADLVVADGRVETLVEALLEGRALWTSVKDAVAILVGGNLGEIAFSLFGGLLDGRPPLNARQLMLVNLLTDALPALTLAVREPRAGRPEDLATAGPEGSLGASLDRAIAWRAAVTAGAAGFAWTTARWTGGRASADTVALLTLCGTQIGQTLLAAEGDKTARRTAWASLATLLAIVETPGVSHFFGSRPVGPISLGLAAGTATAGTIASAILPRVADRAATAFQARWTAEGWSESEVVRLFAESRTLHRIREQGRRVRGEEG